ncbi:hypothetical protein [Paenarthrobacter nitroguajacolicus]
MERVENHLRSWQIEINPQADQLPDVDGVAQLMRDFIKALGNLMGDLSSTDAASHMAEAQKNIIAAQRRCAAHQPLRPSVTLQRTLTDSLTLVAMLWPTYSQALTAPTLHEAQEFGKKGQQLIDEVEADRNAYETLVETTKAYEDFSIRDFLERALAAAAVSHPGLSLLELGSTGRQKATRVTGVETDEAHGAQYLLLSTVASVHLDPVRFNTVLADSAKFCIAAPNLESIADEEGALAELSKITRMLHEALTSYEGILARESDSDTLLRRIIKFYGEIYEDVGGQLFAWYNLLANIKQQPYLKLIQQNDATKLARNLVECPTTQSFLEDPGAHLRNAAQHGSSFALTGESVAFRLRTHQEQWTRAQVVDAVFSLLESLSAMSWSLSNALAQRGKPVPLSAQDAAYMRLTPFRLVTLWIKDHGIALVSASETEDSWRFIIEKNSDDLFVLALTLAGGAPENITQIGLRSEALNTDLLVPAAAVDLFSRWPGEGATPQEHLLAVLELRSHCWRGQGVILTKENVRHGVACLGLLLIQGDRSKIPFLRRIQRMAKDHGWSPEAAVAAECISLWRKPDVQKERSVVSNLSNWLNANPAPEMPQARSIIVSRRP